MKWKEFKAEVEKKHGVKDDTELWFIDVNLYGANELTVKIDEGDGTTITD